MNSGLISMRYAKALYEFALENKAEEKVYNEVRFLTQVMSGSDGLLKVLIHPVLPKIQKEDLLFSVFKGKIQPILKKFIQTVFDNKREEFILYILLKYIDLYRKEKNILAGKLIVAAEIESATEKKLIQVIESRTHGTLEMEKIIQPSIIGGFILEVDNIRWDASVTGQLKTLRKNFTEQNRKSI